MVDGSSKISDENIGGSDSPISETINPIKEKKKHCIRLKEWLARNEAKYIHPFFVVESDQ